MKSHSYGLRKRKVPEPDNAEPADPHPIKRARIGEHNMSPLKTSMATPVASDSFTGPIKHSTRTRKPLQPDSVEALDNLPMEYSRIEERVISPFETLMGAPVPSAMLAGPKNDRISKRKKPGLEEDRTGPIDIFPTMKRARAEGHANALRQVSGMSVRTQDEEGVSHLDTGQPDIAFFAALIADLILIDIVYISGPSTSFAGNQIQSRKRKASELGPFDLAPSAPPRRKIARSTAMYRSVAQASLSAPQALAGTRTKQHHTS